jgi:hypothetical protein
MREKEIMGNVRRSSSITNKKISNEKWLEPVSKPMWRSAMFAVALHHRPETKQEKGRESQFCFLLSPLLLFDLCPGSVAYHGALDLPHASPPVCSWHTVGIPMRKEYARFVELSNKGAVALDYTDTGAMWRGKYDMPADAF